MAKVIPFYGKDEAEMLRLAACLEEHFPHSMANAVVEEARRRGLNHEERHAKVEYLVAHGIASSVDGEQVRIGSAHFIFEDEKVTIPEGEQAKFDALPPEYSQLYLAIGGVDVYKRQGRLCGATLRASPWQSHRPLLQKGNGRGTRPGQRLPDDPRPGRARPGGGQDGAGRQPGAAA